MLDGKMSFEQERLRELKGINVDLKLANKKLETHTFHLVAQVLEVQQEAIAVAKAATIIDKA